MTGPVEALRRLFTTGLPPIPGNREIGEYLAAARIGRTDQPAAEPTPEAPSWAARVRAGAAQVYGRRPGTHRGGSAINDETETR